MNSLPELRARKPRPYPDAALYAEYVATRLGLDFTDLDDGTGLLFSVSARGRTAYFGGGRCSVFPQNTATSATLAADKYLLNRLLESKGFKTTGGQYFFLHERHRALRHAGHERADAHAWLDRIGGTGFAKPLTGSRGDFACGIPSHEALAGYMEDVSQFHDSIILQPVFSGEEYRLFVLDGRVLYCARKYPPALDGDGTSSIRELLENERRRLEVRGISSIEGLIRPRANHDQDQIPARGTALVLEGRMNLGAGGTMVFEDPPMAGLAYDLAIQAAGAVGLKAAGVDIFAHTDASDTAFTIIEINANPSIRFLETGGRVELIEAVWTSTFRHTGLLGAGFPNV